MILVLFELEVEKVAMSMWCPAVPRQGENIDLVVDGVPQERVVQYVTWAQSPADPKAMCVTVTVG